METVRKRFLVTGVVQGVGFRPFVHSLATELTLSGFVRNDASGVVVEVEGDPGAVERFSDRIQAGAPPLAVIERIVVDDIAVTGRSGFTIVASHDAGFLRSPISVDAATCVACRDEIEDAAGRRFRYAFTNCTNCGPRFTIATGVPYDRANTTMASFEMCSDCRAEYEDPGDRRFHAQPIACPVCGPKLRLIPPHEAEDDPLRATARLIRDGGVVAVKGLGGFHLACDATNDSAVEDLRGRKGREEKPLAVMARDLDQVRELADLSRAEGAILGSHRRPIVLLRRRSDADLASAVAPGNRFVGIMLPYTPLHHLLLAEVGRPLVLTSGNLSDEPIVYEDDDARERLHDMADAFLSHDRPIYMRCDDSVIRVVDERTYPIRRSRGYAPEPLFVSPGFAEPVLGVGAELKSTFCFGVGTRAIVSHHIGDLESYEAMSAFTAAVAHYRRMFDVTPQVVAHDLHPDYLSTKWAGELEDVELVGIQHHHAHIAACLADNDRSDRVIGLALDGTGLGDDGALWGCEVLVCDRASYERAAHLRYVPLPGGAMAIKEPWRMAAVYLQQAFGDPAADLPLALVRRTGHRWPPVLQMAAGGINSPLASSAGRLFDAAAALCGARDRVTYEGQAAAELEQLADPEVDDAYPCSVDDDVIDGAELIAALASDLAEGRTPAQAAAAFHNGLARALVQICDAIRDREGPATVALSGGTFQNLLLLDRVRAGLRQKGFEVLIHHRIPTNDGGISLGQVTVANARRERGLDP